MQLLVKVKARATAQLSSSVLPESDSPYSRVVPVCRTQCEHLLLQAVPTRLVRSVN